MTKSLLILANCLLLTACGAKGDLYMPAEKPVEQQPADSLAKPDPQSEQSDS